VGAKYCNLLHITILVSRILKWPLHFWKICALLGKTMGIQEHCGIKHLLIHVLSSALVMGDSKLM